ncbi:plasmid replication initiator TrfA [Arsenophonus nasoniae]|uniref:Plasmid replication initiator TrfA n=1 Tax=Arsenophonus nasoniae TaxID=638 RepID=A0AA95GCW6_9GAMM|nr:plasmid replication initiator TrfA [Arsenophonus nasoniae]WGL93865.1 plasmid replication initiator TrfA [Arsenophonus nasoniae]
MNLFDRVNNIAEKIAEQGVKKTKVVDQQNEKEVFLPMTKSTILPSPNVILRSALFGIMKKDNRKYEENVLKATFKGYTVKYTGKQLDQSDLDVWLECLQRCQSTPLGHTVRFKPNDFLKSIKRQNGKSDYVWLKISLLRLKTNALEVSDGKYTYIGSLIDVMYRDEETGENCLVLNPKIVSCFGDAGWTGIKKEIRLKLKGKPLTLWLHAFYCSHNKPLPIKVTTLKELCGSTSTVKDFKQKLKRSLLKLSSVTEWQCSIDENDKVIIKK